VDSSRSGEGSSPPLKALLHKDRASARLVAVGIGSPSSLIWVCAVSFAVAVADVDTGCLIGFDLRVPSRVVSPGWVSTDGSVGGVNCCVEGEGALVEGKRALVEDVAVSFVPTALPSDEVEGKSSLEICVGDLLVGRECGEAVLPPGDFGRSKPKIARNRSRFLGFS